MLEKALEVLKILENNGYSAYIVGGYVRDSLLNINTTDIDICTSATPKDIVNLFGVKELESNKYGSVLISYKGNDFDITTFRKDIKYENNRRPIKIKYINEIKKDLLRRDFTINTFCLDKDNNFFDFLNVYEDLLDKVIKTVGNPRYKIKEDSLRILRAIRFATVLDFDIDKKTKHYLIKYGYLLKRLSYYRKRKELDKIFFSSNKKRGIDLILELKLDKYLEIYNLDKVVCCDNIIGIWSQLDFSSKYPFSKLERQQINEVRELLKNEDIDNYALYKYDLYICTIVADIKGIDKKKLSEIRDNLPILSRKDINITSLQVKEILKNNEISLNAVFCDLEKGIVDGIILNDFIEIKKYILNKYVK